MNDWDVLRRPMTVYRHVFVVGFDRQSFVERAGILFQTALTKMPKYVCRVRLKRKVSSMGMLSSLSLILSLSTTTHIT